MPSDLPILKPIKLNGYTLDLKKILSTDWSDISLATTALPQYAEWINEQLHSMTENKLASEGDLRVARAEAYFRLRTGGLDRYGVAKVTEAAVEHAVELDDRVREITSDLARLDGWCRRLSRLADTLCRQMELIRSSEATRRKIFDTDSK